MLECLLEATLPTSSFATAEVKDNFQGIINSLHTRIYVDSEFTFYVDTNYKMLKFLRVGWIIFLERFSKPLPETNTRGYYRKFNYPLGILPVHLKKQLVDIK